MLLTELSWPWLDNWSSSKMQAKMTGRQSLGAAVNKGIKSTCQRWLQRHWTHSQMLALWMKTADWRLNQGLMGVFFFIIYCAGSWSRETKGEMLENSDDCIYLCHAICGESTKQCLLALTFVPNSIYIYSMIKFTTQNNKKMIFHYSPSVQ